MPISIFLDYICDFFFFFHSASTFWVCPLICLMYYFVGDKSSAHVYTYKKLPNVPSIEYEIMEHSCTIQG